jgi:hypothetical protein
MTNRIPLPKDIRELHHFTRGGRNKTDNLERKLQELVDRGVLKENQFSDVVAEHQDGCPKLTDGNFFCQCDVEIYNMQDERLA